MTPLHRAELPLVRAVRAATGCTLAEAARAVQATGDYARAVDWLRRLTPTPGA